MRLKEERFLIIIEVVILLFIVLASSLLQFVDAKVKDYNDEIISMELHRSQYLQLLGYWSRRVEYWELFGVLNQLGINFEKKLATIDESNLDKEIKKIKDELEVGTISNQNFMGEMRDLSRRKTIYYESRVNETAAKIESIHRNPPNLFRINLFLFQKTCLYVQFIGAIIGIILYARLFRKIGKRIEENHKP